MTYSSWWYPDKDNRRTYEAVINSIDFKQCDDIKYDSMISTDPIILTLNNDAYQQIGFAFIHLIDNNWVIQLACSEANAFDLIKQICDEAKRLNISKIKIPHTKDMLSLIEDIGFITPSRTKPYRTKPSKTKQKIVCNSKSCSGKLIILDVKQLHSHFLAHPLK